MKMLKILVVEDVPVVRVYIKYVLKSLGYEAHYADNAEQALMLYYENKYDLILNDLKLPGMDGFVMSKKIRRFERKYCLPSAEIITITSSNIKTIIESIMQSGINAVIEKPVNINDLSKLIVKCESNLLKQ